MKQTALTVLIGFLSVASWAQPTMILERAFGGPGQDLSSGMMTDPEGNAIFAGQSKSFVDTTYGDMVVMKMDPKGKLLWARNYGSPGADVTRNYIDGEYGGPARTLALGKDGSVYVAARTEYAQRKEPFGALIFKLSPAGDLVWSKVWKVHDKNQMNGAAQASALTVSGDTVFATGMTGGGQTSEEGMIWVGAFDAKDGTVKDILAVDPTVGSNDRAFTIVATPAGDALYVGGWNGRSARGQLLKFTYGAGKLALGWVKEIPLETRGSTVCDIDIDAKGDLYLAGDIHGASNWLEVVKVSGEGQFIWSRRYNHGVRNDKNHTRLVRVFGDKLLVGGKVALGGTNTEADTFFGDGALLILSLDGKLLLERYYFTGTQQSVLAQETIVGAGISGNDLILGGWVYPYKANYKGEWRDPANYKTVQHAFTEVPASAYPIVDVADTKTFNLTSSPARNGADAGLAFKDITATVKVGSAEEMSKTGSSTLFVMFVMKGVF
jgi:hypothetical protein